MILPLTVLVWAPVAGCALLALGAPALMRRLAPGAAVLTLTAAAVLATGCWLYCLGLLAATILGQVPAVALLGHWSAPVLRTHDPVSPVVGLSATLLLAVLSLVAIVAVLRRGRALLAAERLVRAYRDTTLLVLTDPTPDAYAIGGLTGGCVAVSTGMLSALEPDERSALLAHEHAHLSGRHHLLRITVGLAAAVNPLLARLPRMVEASTERWADEIAAASVGDRRLVARALSRAALASLHNPPARPGPVMGRAAFHQCDVPGRVDALLRPAPSASLRPALLVTLLVAAVIAATLGASNDMEQIFEHARRAYLATG
jgi:Zn-dependent protease with chaperone function